MDKNKLRQIKEVQGWKVNHPYEAGNIVYLVLTFILIALPAFIIFYPLVGFETNPTLSFNGRDLIEFLFFNQANITNNAMNKLGTIGSSNVEIQKIVAYLLMAQAVFCAVFALFSLIYLVFFIVNLIKGYLRKAVHIKRLALLEMILMILFSLSFMAYSVLDMNFNNGNNRIIYAASFVPSGVIIIVFIALCITYSTTYKDVIYEKNLRITVKHVDDDQETKTEEKTEEEPEESIPQDIKEIEDHAYSEHQNLYTANIPEGVSKIGEGAFANCLKLKTVNIPKSVKSIGFNCFFHCVELVKISYNGTKEEWRHVKRGSNWLAQCKASEVSCSDGPVVVNPFN